MSNFFEDLGRKLGRAAVPTYRKSKWIWDGLTGTEEEALQAEKDLGATLAAELRLATDIPVEPDLLNWIRGICRRLQPSVDQPGFAYHCELMESDHPSTIGLPGGYLFVSRSLIDFCEGSVEEVAFVIAHETAHVVRRHTWDRMIQQSALRAASFAAGRAGILSGWVRQQGLPLLRSAHSMDIEYEADRDGVDLLRAAGYDPGGAISFLKRIERIGTDSEVLGEYLASHPAPAERIARLQSGRDA
ncbi:MAG: M48 family metalloprotease [Verrucomicrobiales bacterium]|jgi:predicted Zn-dependent protease|nr:M48 family metalloprotease [Verrucomicrobiales bacterium]MBP9224421.1 M48 family metalloprotease [Verrucomicrobiales bacterium]